MTQLAHRQRKGRGMLKEYGLLLGKKKKKLSHMKIHRPPTLAEPESLRLNERPCFKVEHGE